jgi:integrase/recombinase XerD
MARQSSMIGRQAEAVFTLPVDNAPRAVYTMASKPALARGVNTMLLETARDQFLGFKRDGSPRQRRCQPDTLRTYHEHLTWFIKWVIAQRGRSSVLFMTAEILTAYVQHRRDRGLSLHSQNLTCTVLREFVRFGAQRRYCSAELLEVIPKVDKPKTLPRPYAAGDRDAMLDLSLDPEEDALRALLYYAGLRNAEVRRIRLQHIVPPHVLGDRVIQGHLRIWGKGAKERIVEMHPALWPALERYLKTLAGVASDRYLFQHRNGKPWSYKQVTRRVRAWAEEAGGVATPKPHRFRHTFATDFLEANPDDIRTLQALLGHADLGTTGIYTQVVDRRRGEAISRLPTLGQYSRTRVDKAVLPPDKSSEAEAET